MKTKLFTVSLFMVHCSVAQWSTSTNADSALYVCPGYYPSIITFEDGSSIICGSLNDYRFVQKLDPFGHKVWPQPVEVYYTPGTNDPFSTGMVSDGDGGVILLWQDYREANYFPGPQFFGPFNNAIFIQRVDKSGAIRWHIGGVQVDSVSGGLKSAFGVRDGQGGVVLYEEENILDNNHMVEKAYTRLVRYDKDGNRVWANMIDSSTSTNGLNSGQPIKLGNRVMIGAQNRQRFFDPIGGGTLPPPTFVPDGSNVLDGDSAAFNLKHLSDKVDSVGRKYRVYAVTRFDFYWDSVWSNGFKVLDAGDLYNTMPFNNNIFPDRVGGLFYWDPSSNDSTKPGARLRRVTRYGSEFNNDQVQVFPSGASWGFNGVGQSGIYSEGGEAIEFDTTGKSLWPQDYVVLNNTGNADAMVVASDNNGGAIIAFWTTVGGIYAQHTGRMGKVGIITKVPTGRSIPSAFELDQNFPNPFNPATSIQYKIAGRNHVTLKIYDVLGREVATLVNGYVESGEYNVTFDAPRLSSGIYFYELRTGSFRSVKKMLLMK